MKKLIAIVFILGLIFTSCSEEKKKEEKKSDNVENADEENLAENTPLKTQIDDFVWAQDTSLEHYSKVNSLPFLNSKEEIEFQSYFYYDNEGNLKIIEEYKNTRKNQSIKRFYYDGKEMKYVSSIYIDYENDKNYLEKKYYFDKEQLVFVDQVKGFESPATSVSVEGEGISNETALQMLNFEGEYEITFNGFIEQPAGVFLVVNASKPGYNSALIVDQAGADKFIEDLYDNQKSYLGKQLKLKWEAVVDPANGLRQNAYRGGEWAQ
jgi:hypothetical protein